MRTAPSTCRAIKIILLFVVLAQDVLSFVTLQVQQPQVARLIKIPLIRDITPGVGTHGQPVVSYYAPVDIGSPAKRFYIQFDVGYTDLFIPHYTWNPFKFNLHYGKGYLCKQSSTCVKIDKEFTSNCHSCIITGKPNEDVVSLSSAYKASNASSAPALQLPVSFRQSFLAASDASTGKYRYVPVDGFFGLFSSPQSSTGSLTNPILSLHNAQLIDNLQFSFWFNPVLDSNQGGEIVFGGVDTARYQGQIYWHRLVNMDGSWTLNLQQVTLGGQLIGCNQPRCTATTSSWVNEVHGPAAQVQRIYDLLNTVMSADGLPLIDCRRISQMPILTLNIDGIPYSLLPSNYVRKTTDTSNFKTETCYVAILPSEGRQHGNQWVLGTNFMGAYYSTYDLTHRQVGFASLR